VKRFRASISPDNQPSLRIIHKFGFHPTGHHHDEVDGLELVFERDAGRPRPYTPVDTT
jgi:RimJ/RimL family protein N-acetyltransferase